MNEVIEPGKSTPLSQAQKAEALRDGGRSNELHRRYVGNDS